jgi:outer membrane protein assembly factor BamA
VIKPIAIILLSVLSLCARGQKDVTIVIEENNSKTTKSFPDSVSLDQYIQKLLREYYADGYLYASYSFRQPWSAGQPEVLVTTKKRIKLKKIEDGNIDKTVLHSIGFNKKSVSRWHTPNPEQILEWENKIITYYENNGYPFAMVSFNIDSFIGDSVCASWHVTPGQAIVFDSIVQKGKFKPSDGYISGWLGIEKGKPYDERKISAYRQRLNISELVEEEKPMQIHFTEGKARLYFYLKKKKSNLFDGILGFSPDRDNPAKLVFNGDVNLRLSNSFNHGDLISMKWKSSANNSQEINLKASVPYIFSLPVGVNTALDIYKRDTLFLRTKQHYGLNFFSGIAGEIEFFIENTETHVIDQSIFRTATSLPAWADSRSTTGGLRIYVPKTDNLFVPHNGYMFSMEASGGKKKIFKNADAPETIYQNIDLETYVASFISEISLFKPIAGALHLMGNTRLGFIEAPKLFENDLFLLGGLHTLRGFDEKSMAASRYSVSTVELRFFFEKFSYLTLFTDYAVVRQIINNTDLNKYYISLGCGLSFSTKAGIFNIFYALGKQNPGDFSLRNGKVHFGFATRF